MRRSVLLAVALLALVGGLRAEDVDEKDVLVLTDKNFADKLAAVKYALGASTRGSGRGWGGNGSQLMT